MKTIRVFVSSPGDVGRERVLAAKVIERLQGEFLRRALLRPYIWEHEPMRGSADYQTQIPPTSDFDIVICILWSRLGSRLSGDYRRKDGTPYDSGTEYELTTAYEAARASSDGRPAILIYLNRQKPVIPMEPEDLVAEKQRQYKQLKAFLKSWLTNEDGTARIATNEYSDSAAFEERLESDLRRLIEEVAPPVSGPAPDPTFGNYSRGSPFRPLRYFEFEDAAIFFGRRKAIDEVLDAMRDQAAGGCAFTLIFGGSGMGKSSLARAGVLPLLVQPGVIEGVGLWRHAVMRPTEIAEDIFGGLARALIQALPELTKLGTSEATLAANLKDGPATVPALIRAGLIKAAEETAEKERLERPPTARLALLVDQLEEIFTVNRFPPAIRDRFFTALRFLASPVEAKSEDPVWILATLRSEFFSRCEEIPELVKMKSGRGTYQLLSPTRVEISQIVRMPAIAAGLEFESDAERGSVDELLIEAMEKDPNVLPLLEFTLDELYKRRANDRFLTHAALDTLGGIEGAIQTAAEEVFVRLRPEVAAELEPVFRALVTVEASKGVTFVRRVATQAQVAVTPARQEFIRAFVEARLLVTNVQLAADGQACPTLEVAHETVFRSWPRLRLALENDVAFLALRARAGAAYAQWNEQKRERSYLWWSGQSLLDAQSLLTRSAELSDAEREFAAASVAAGASAGRKRLFLTAAAILVAVAAGASAYVWWQDWRRDRALKDLRNQLEQVASKQPVDAMTMGELARRVLTLDPGDSLAHARAAEALLATGRYAEFDAALEHWERTVRPRSPHIDALRGDKASKEGRYEEAVAAWQAFLRAPGLSVEERRPVWRKLAEAQAAARDWENAIVSLTDWFKADPSNFDALILRAKAYQATRQRQLMANDVAAARQISPGNPLLAQFPAVSDTRPLDELDALVQTKPNDPAAWLARANEYTRQRQFEAALDDVERALSSLEPDSARLAIAKGHLLWQLQRPIPEELGVRPTPEWTRAEERFLAAFEAIERSYSALDHVEARIRQQPNVLTNYFQRGETLARLGQHVLALRDFDRVLRERPDALRPLEARTASYRALGRTDEADADLRRLAELQRNPSPPNEDTN